MKWRCAWCGKPHAENDPPCDNCGHGEFEKAVVPAAPDGDQTTSDAYGYVWVCTECGHEHPKNTPPCDRCGHNEFERRPIEFDEDEVMDEMLGRSGTSSTPSVDVSYLDVLDARLALMIVGVAVLLVLLALAFFGIVHIPGVNIGPTRPVDAPGNATEYQGLSLSNVESEYLVALNDRRQSDGYDALTPTDDLGGLAERVNKRRVAAAYGDASEPNVQQLVGDANLDCGRVGTRSVVIPATRLDNGTLAGYDTERAAARALVDAQFGTDGGGDFLDVDGNRAGVDVHVAPDGTVYVFVAAC